MQRHRLRVAEAWLLLAFARLLVRFAPFARWQGLLGPRCAPDAPQDGAPPRPLALACAAALRRAALRQPRALCLPQAMALHWMLRRRRLASRLLLGPLPRQDRFAGGDLLHAWVEHGRTNLSDGTDQSHVAVIAFGGASPA